MITIETLLIIELFDELYERIDNLETQITELQKIPVSPSTLNEDGWQTTHAIFGNSKLDKLNCSARRIYTLLQSINIPVSEIEIIGAFGSSTHPDTIRAILKQLVLFGYITEQKKIDEQPRYFISTNNHLI